MLFPFFLLTVITVAANIPTLPTVPSTTTDNGLSIDCFTDITETVLHEDGSDLEIEDPTKILVKNETHNVVSEENDELTIIEEDSWIGGHPDRITEKQENKIVDKKMEEDDVILWDLVQFLIMITPVNSQLPTKIQQTEITWWTILVEAVKCSMRHCNGGPKFNPKVITLPRITRKRRETYCRCELELEKLISQL